MLRDLFDRWEQVWHEGQYHLVPSCVAENYIRHDKGGDRTATREAYAMGDRQDLGRSGRIYVSLLYDHSFGGEPRVVSLCIQVA